MTRRRTRRPRPWLRLAARRHGARYVGWYSRLSFARKLGLFPKLTAAALGLVLVVSVALGLAAERRLVRLGTTYYPRVERTWRLEQTLAALQRSLQDAAATDDAEFLGRADSLANAFVALAPPRDDVHRQFAAYYRSGRALTARLRAGEAGDDITRALVRFHARHNALRTTLDAMAREERASLVHTFAAERAQQRVAWTASLAIMLAFVVVVIALTRLATRSLTVPLRRAVAAADRIAEGDLRVTLPDASDDEVGHLLRSMRRMVEHLRRSDERLTHLAYHDALTGLANRMRFRQRIARAAAEPDGRGTLAVLYIDLDDFKSVNDSLGHAAGDALLVEAANRMLQATRGCDTVARLGGDEFAVLLRGARSAADAVIVAERVSRALAAPARVFGTELSVRASVGIALGAEALGPEVLSPDGDAGQAAEDLLRFADVAMYAAKRGGKGHHVVFEPAMHRRAQERRALEHDLHDAIARGQMRLHFQPIVALDGEHIVGAEALLRWEHPTRGAVSPAEFIPLAEETGLVVPIGRWAIEEACREAACWRADALAAGRPDDAMLSVAVNLSAAQLQHADFVSDVRAALAQARLPAAALTLEITETAMLADTTATVARVVELKALGVALAVDDFGTGYSSLSYLQTFPVDVLKIDRAFVEAIGVSGHDPVLTRAIIALGGALGLRVVAEGIEHASQARALHALGCTLGQGHHFGHPMAAADFRRLLPHARRHAAVVV